MHSLMVSYVRMFTYVHHLDILSLTVCFVTFITLFMALSKLLGLDFYNTSLSNSCNLVLIIDVIWSLKKIGNKISHSLKLKSRSDF
jgi:hypothetical protein